MLCLLCANFNDALISLARYKHQQSYQDLEAAASSGCPLCTMVRDVNQDQQNVGSQDFQSTIDSPTSKPVICPFGSDSSRLQLQWQSDGKSVAVALSASFNSGTGSNAHFAL